MYHIYLQDRRWNCYGDLKKEVKHFSAGLGELGHSTVKVEALAMIRICRMTRLSLLKIMGVPWRLVFTGKICILTEQLRNMKQRDYEVWETWASYPSSDQTASENSE